MSKPKRRVFKPSDLKLLGKDADQIEVNKTEKRARGRPKGSKKSKPIVALVPDHTPKPTFKSKPKSTEEKKPMAKVKVSTEEIQAAVAEQVAEGILSNGFGSHEAPRLSEREVEEEEHETQMRDPTEIEDIFTDIGESRYAKGNVLMYEIYRNGQLIETVEHPYSWEQVLKDLAPLHGGGRYRVSAKDPDLRYKYVKHQQKILGNPKRKPETGQVAQTPPTSQVVHETPPTDISELAVKLMDMNRQVMRESLQMAKESQPTHTDSSSEMVKAVLGTLGQLVAAKTAPQADNSDKTALLLEKVTNTFERALDKVLGQVEKLADKVNELQKAPKSDAFGAKEIMQMMQEARDDGYERHKELIAEAREHAEEIAERRGGGSEESEPKAAWEKALEIGANALARAQAMSQAAAPRIPRRNPMIANQPQSVPSESVETAQVSATPAPQAAPTAPKASFKERLVAHLTPIIMQHLSEKKSAAVSAELVRANLISKKVTSAMLVKTISKEELTAGAEPLGQEVVAWLAAFWDNMNTHANIKISPSTEKPTNTPANA